MAAMTPELAERLPQLLDAMVAIGSDVELHSLLDRVVTTAAELTGARYAAVAVLNEEGSEVGQFVTYGVEPSVRERIGRLPGGAGLIRALLENAEPLLLDNIADDARSVGLPPGHPPVTSLLGVPVRVHGATFGALFLSEKKGGSFSTDDLRMIQVLATEAGIAVGNARLYDAVRQRARWMDGSAELTTSLLSEDGDNALAVVAEQARRLADADAALVLVPTPDEGLEVVALSSDHPNGLIGRVLPGNSELAGLLRAGEPVFMTDAATDPRRVSEVGLRFGPTMLLPLFSSGQTLGALALPRLPGSREYSVHERAMATQFAQQAALALMLTEAQRDREQLAVYEDRDRIARDLHDLVIQRLFATGMLLEGARRSAEPELQERISRVTDELDATIQEIRTTIFALQQDPGEAPAGVRTRVLRETGTAAALLGFQPSVSFTGPVDSRVGEGVTKNLIAALREALSNVSRHAGASRAEVTLDASAQLPDGRDAVRMTVSDDGRGLRGKGRSSGLRNLTRRAESLGGEATFGPGLGEAGTRLVWQVPL